MKEQMNIAKDKMEKTLKVLGSEFAAIRAGRANPAVLDRITVEYYGAQTPILKRECLLSSHGIKER